MRQDSARNTRLFSKNLMSKRKHKSKETHHHIRKEHRKVGLSSALQNFKIQTELVDEDGVHCLAYPYALLDLKNDHYEDDPDENYGDLVQYPSHVGAKKKWKRLFEVIMDKRTAIPLKQMALKAKHEQVIFDQM